MSISLADRINFPEVRDEGDRESFRSSTMTNKSSGALWRRNSHTVRDQDRQSRWAPRRSPSFGPLLLNL